ncbi:galactose mutarotase (plasmid) [Phyllobacterium sp. 628]|uniref:aldose epimerase family protein n=1 Tax=Phyllobacterium sp. 628 TaxID=2718938 RepID=UPI0016622652|nr:aldose epimerase family protein [Phyllobacterium sp. 628]QND50554.1 galactose mutarotase [Phyllobacterium sp. 628]
MRALLGPQPFGMFSGEPVFQATIQSPSGALAHILNWGAVIRDLQVPLLDGKLQRVVLGFDTFDPYPLQSPYFGALVGRYANRIAHGRFSLDGKDYQLNRNEGGKQTLHGGANGVSQRLWTVTDWNASSVTLALHLPDGDQGFPGAMNVRCTYSFGDNSTLRVEVEADTDAPTVANFAQHSYFNLDGSDDIRDHTLQIFASSYTPVSADLIPTGEIAPVETTPFDFQLPQLIGTHASASYDHNFVLSGTPRNGLRFAASLGARNGLEMQVHTSETGLQFYDGAMIAPSLAGLDGKRYGPHAGLCLEAQCFPDSPNQPHFPSAVLRPGETYRQHTEFRFYNR